jgi:membrane fusion protein (multidrug efflux system)
MGPPEVGVVILRAESVTLTAELAGRTSPYAISDVRPQITGIVKERLFKEGANVAAGQVLYRIDPATYQAALDSAKAQLDNAEANLATLKLKAERAATLLTSGWVSRQTNDDALAAYRQALATVSQQKANVESAAINLGYTRITAPIAGRIGVSSVTPGALVTANQAAVLTTIQTLDPIYVDVTQSSAELLQLKRAITQGSIRSGGPGVANVSLKLEDGTAYAHTGQLELTDVTVDQNTGAVTLRALFPNPEGLLLPGMYVRAIVAEGVANDAILAPQQGVTRNEKGEPTAMIVDAQGKAQTRVLKTSRVIGDRWLVTDGLKAGDRLIVEGLLKVQPDMQVNAVPAGSAPQPASAASGPKG